MTWADSVKAVLWIVSMGALLFLSAGTLDWRGGWIFMAEFVIGGLAVTLWLAWRDPGLLKERMGGPFQKGQAFWDKVFMAFIIVVWFAWLVLMALDAKRWNLSHMPEALNYAGAVLIPIGFFIVWLTFRENSFAAPVIKFRRSADSASSAQVPTGSCDTRGRRPAGGWPLPKCAVMTFRSSSALVQATVDTRNSNMTEALFVYSLSRRSTSTITRAS